LACSGFFFFPLFFFSFLQEREKRTGKGQGGKVERGRKGGTGEGGRKGVREEGMDGGRERGRKGWMEGGREEGGCIAV